jgi:hypothetical protein
MSDDRKKPSAVFWLIVAGGVVGLVGAAAIIAAVLMLATGRVPTPLTKHFEAPPVAPVTGTVTLDGKPVKSAIVKFVPLVDSTKGSMRGSTSFDFTDADGKYTLTYAIGGDGKAVMGAVVGLHQVQIQLNDPSGESHVPEKYSTVKSDLKADVKLGMPPLDFALKSEPVEARE